MKIEKIVILNAVKDLRVVSSVTAARASLHRYHPPMHDRGYFTYIMAGRSHTLYIAVTGDLHRRVFEHKWHEQNGFTARYNCDGFVWFESYQDVHNAITREKQLKGWLRARKIALIESTNPAWLDLARDGYEVDPADYRRWLGRAENCSAPTADPSLRSG